ncbi:unnamed protein product, partial [Mesorhabditis spiculigera]
MYFNNPYFRTHLRILATTIQHRAFIGVHASPFRRITSFPLHTFLAILLRHVPAPRYFGQGYLCKFQLRIEFRPGQKGLCYLRSYAPEPDTKVYDSDPGELGYYIGPGDFRTPIQSRWMASVIEMGDIITDHVRQRQEQNNPLMLSELDALLLPAKPDAFGQGDWHCFIGQEVSHIMMEGQDDGDFCLTMRPPVTPREEKPRRWHRDF